MLSTQKAWRVNLIEFPTDLYGLYPYCLHCTDEQTETMKSEMTTWEPGGKKDGTRNPGLSPPLGWNHRRGGTAKSICAQHHLGLRRQAGTVSDDWLDQCLAPSTRLYWAIRLYPLSPKCTHEPIFNFQELSTYPCKLPRNYLQRSFSRVLNSSRLQWTLDLRKCYVWGSSDIRKNPLRIWSVYLMGMFGVCLK